MKAVLLGGQNSPNKNCVACDFNAADFQHGSLQGRQNRNGTTRWSKLSQAGEPAPRDSPGRKTKSQASVFQTRLGPYTCRKVMKGQGVFTRQWEKMGLFLPN